LSCILKELTPKSPETRTKILVIQVVTLGKEMPTLSILLDMKDLALKANCIFVNTQVHGSRFTVGNAFFIFFEIVDESTNGSTCSSGLLVDIFEFVGRYVLFIQGDIEFALDFRARPLGVSQEPDKLRIHRSLTVNLEPWNFEPE